jgi:anti-anti-sigma regulatory factor
VDSPYGGLVDEQPVATGDPAGVIPLDVRTSADGSVVVQVHGSIGPDQAGELRQVLVHTVRRVRPRRLVVDLADVGDLDPINLGTLAATCELGDDHDVAVVLANAPKVLAEQLATAGVQPHRFRAGD